MSSETVTMTERSSPTAPTACCAPQLWNPRAAACWSLLFSPAFGAYLHMLNWKNLGEAEKATEARTWFRMLCGLLAINLIIAAFAIAHGEDSPVPSSLGLALTVAWYVWSARSQVRYVADVQRSNYARNGWAKPVFIAIAASVAYWLLTIGVSKLIIISALF